MKMSVTSRLFPAVGLSLAMMVISCSSSDLGDKKPDRVGVDMSLTGWDNGAGKVIATKCASCHTDHRSGFVPANTPMSINGIESLDFFKKPENRVVAKMMRNRIEAVGQKRQMPPRFATPLFDDERAAVLSFLKMVEDGGFAVTPNSGDCLKTASLVARHGDDDNGDDDHGHHGHDDHGSGNGQNGGAGESSGGQIGGSPCVPSTPSNPSTPSTPSNPSVPADPNTPALKFADIQPIIAATCGGCHDGVDNVKLATREDFVAEKPFPLNKISSGAMPKGNPGWKDTADGKKVIQWLMGPQTE
jgi:mono/diheme cytochrome c family protein